MGDIADMIREGILCQICGGYIDEGEANDCPRTCGFCEKEEAKLKRRQYKRPLKKGVKK